jgi:hypothetical protein
VSRHQSNAARLPLKQRGLCGFAPGGLIFNVFNEGRRAIDLETASDVDQPVHVSKDALATLAKCKSCMRSRVFQQEIKRDRNRAAVAGSVQVRKMFERIANRRESSVEIVGKVSRRVRKENRGAAEEKQAFVRNREKWATQCCIDTKRIVGPFDGAQSRAEAPFGQRWR